MATLTPADTQTHDDHHGDYITCSKGIMSWLITLDHKRIGVMYVIATLASFLLGGLFALGTFDMIVSNPPYIKTADWMNLAPEVKNFESRIALDGGNDGMDLARTIVSKALGLDEAGQQLLQPGGDLWLELDFGQPNVFASNVESNGHKAETFTDFTGQADRFLYVRCAS